MGVVIATQGELATGSARRVLGQPKPKLGGLDKAGRDALVEDGGDTVNGDSLPSHPEYTVELGLHEGDAGLHGGLSEGAVGDVDATEVDQVIVQVALHGAAAVLDGEVAPVNLVGGRLGRGVLLVVEAGWGLAGGARHPQVGAASVEQHIEVLGRRADGDRTVVLGVAVVLQGDVYGGAVLGGDAEDCGPVVAVLVAERVGHTRDLGEGDLRSRRGGGNEKSQGEHGIS